LSFIQELRRRNVVRVGIAYAVAAWILLQLTDVLVDLLGLPEVAGKYVVLLLLIGFVPALIFAWAFEMTPEGLKREKDVDRSQSITPHTGRKLDFVIIGVLVVALGYFVVDKFILSPAQQAETAAQMIEAAEPAEKAPETIAVLPFVDMSPDGDNEYFSDGLTEELLNILAKIKDLQVAGRTSSFAFKGQNEDLRGIGEKLGVKTILEGSVRKDETGQRVRITAQLVNVENGFHLWSETYDRELKDIFAIQDEIAHEVAAALRITLFGEDEQRLATRAVTEFNAYELYLQGLKNYNDFSYGSLRQAEIDFQQAIEMDPEYVPAQLGLIHTLQELATTGAITRNEKIDRALPMLNIILKNDPGNSEAHVLMSLIRGSQRDSEGQRQELNLALDADARNVGALKEMGRFLFALGNTRTGMEYLREAERIDPYSVAVLWDLCATNVFMLEVEKAESYCGRIGEVQPDNPMRYYGPFLAHQFNGNIPQGLMLNLKAIELDPDDYELPAAMARMWTSLGDIEQAEIWARKAEKLGSGQPIPLVARLGIHLYREQYGMAADLSRRALEKQLDDRLGSEDNFEGIYILSLVQQGKTADALEYFRDKRPGFFEDPPEFQMDVPFRAGDLFDTAYLIQLLDPGSAQAAEMFNAAEAKWALRDAEWFPYFHSINNAKLAVARGQKDRAIKFLFEAFDKNHRTNWRQILTSRIAFMELQQEPEFKRLIAMYEADMDRQREKAYELLGIER
jgi:TolB-like protein/Tfp pilus assembly protein PilF